MSHAFISYAHADVAFAQLVQARLEAQGIDSWMDQPDLKGGQEWLRKIDSSLASSCAVLVILSTHSGVSHYVTYEWAHAMGKGIRVIPLLFERGGDFLPWIKQLQYLDFTDPPLHPWQRLFELLRPSDSAATLMVPDPPPDFRHFVLGNIELPIMLLTGSPSTPFKMPEVTIDYKPIVYHKEPNYPRHLLSAKHYLEAQYRSRYQYTSPQIPSTPLVRISNWEQEGETQNNLRGGLRLVLELTTFDTYLTTNRSLDYMVIPSDSTGQGFSTDTIRHAYVRFPYDLKHSVLSNPLAVMVAIISRSANQEPRDQVIIQYRGDTVASYRNRYQVSAAGYVSMAHKDQNHNPNPFVTAIAEAKEEVADCLSTLNPAEFNLIGLAISWVDMLPLAYGYIVTSIPARQLTGDFARDGYEGTTSTLKFHPQDVLAHIADHKWTPDGAFAMCAALFAVFPRDAVERAASAITPRSMRDYFE